MFAHSSCPDAAATAASSTTTVSAARPAPRRPPRCRRRGRAAPRQCRRGLHDDATGLGIDRWQVRRRWRRGVPTSRAPLRASSGSPAAARPCGAPLRRAAREAAAARPGAAAGARPRAHLARWRPWGGQYIGRVPALALPSLCAVCRSWSRGRVCGACFERFAPAVVRCPRCALTGRGACALRRLRARPAAVRSRRGRRRLRVSVGWPRGGAEVSRRARPGAGPRPTPGRNGSAKRTAASPALIVPMPLGPAAPARARLQPGLGAGAARGSPPAPSRGRPRAGAHARRSAADEPATRAPRHERARRLRCRGACAGTPAGPATWRSWTT